MSKVIIEVNYDGVGQLLTDPAIEQFVTEAAETIAARCGAGYAADTHRMPQRLVASVFTETAEAMEDNANSNTILRETYL